MTTAARDAAAAPAPDAAQARRILAFLHGDDVDAAIDAGLAAFVPLPALDRQENLALVAARDRLRAAWAARDRHRARALRLQPIADQRARAARPSPPGPGDAPATTPADATRPALPAAAAAALARARARTTGGLP